MRNFSIEKSNDLIGNQTRDLPACSMVPQPTTLPRALLFQYSLRVTRSKNRYLYLLHKYTVTIPLVQSVWELPSQHHSLFPAAMCACKWL
jgi:hypothetical protein